MLEGVYKQFLVTKAAGRAARRGAPAMGSGTSANRTAGNGQPSGSRRTGVRSAEGYGHRRGQPGHTGWHLDGGSVIDSGSRKASERLRAKFSISLMLALYCLFRSSTYA